VLIIYPIPEMLSGIINISMMIEVDEPYLISYNFVNDNPVTYVNAAITGKVLG